MKTATITVKLSAAKLRTLEFDMRMTAMWQKQPELYAAIKAALEEVKK